MEKIVQKENKILRQIASEVPIDKIISPRFRKIISRMKEALRSQNDGVAIAAPQIGESWRIFVVSGRIFKRNIDEEKTEDEVEYPDLVFVNPTINNLSKKAHYVEEGCLSIRWLYGKVKRSDKTTVRAYDENGKLFTRGASGLMAQIFQHEVDHLDGILFTDKAKEVREIPPQT